MNRRERIRQYHQNLLFFLRNKKSYIHSKLKYDNILTKVQRSYINFLIEFINAILSSQWRKDLKFLFINSKIKKINKIEKRQELKEQSIGDIIKNEISDKYKNYDKNSL